MGVYIEGLDMPKEHSLWMVIHPNGQVWMRKRHYCQNLEGAEATELYLVRCGECKHWDDEDHWCNIRDSYGWDYKPTDFCSYGERRADEHAD